MLRNAKICFSAIEQAPEAIFIVDTHNCLIHQNPEARKLFGYEDEELQGHSVLERIHHHYQDGTKVPLDHCKVFRAVRYGETARDFTWLVYRKDGSAFYAMCSTGPLEMDGEVVGAIFFATDITAIKAAEDELRDITEQFRLAVDVAEVGLYDYYPKTDTLIWSDTIKKLLGVPPDMPATVDTFFAVLHPDDKARVKKLFTDSHQPGYGDSGIFQFDYRAVGLMDGKERWLASKGRVFFDDDGHPVRRIGAAVEITQRKQIEEAMRQAGHHDSLTGLPNRVLLAEYTEHLFAMADRDAAHSAVLFIDLDRFKPINDLYGHEAGDKVLIEIARRMRSVTRKEDIVSRLGGDEFVIVLPHIDSTADPWTVAQHIQAVVEQPIQLGPRTVDVSASIGISLFPKHGKDLETLIRCADLAMYNAKRHDRNNVQTYIPGHDEKSNDQLQLEVNLKHAIDAGRIALYYQPIIDIMTDELIGVEALLRVIGADGELLTPDEFIPVAESAGLIDRIGNWATNEACQQLHAWRSAGLPSFYVAVNVSALEFKQRTFVKHIARIIQDSGIEPGCLQIEVTENTVMDNISEAVGILNDIRSMGVRIALDDFGTGYSSLSHLNMLPLDKLKIDQSFVRRLDTSESSRSIADTIIALGRAMNLQVVGEGIESLQAKEYLREHGCDQAQGYLYSRPLPANEFESWYRKRAGNLH